MQDFTASSIFRRFSPRICVGSARCVHEGRWGRYVTEREYWFLNIEMEERFWMIDGASFYGRFASRQA
ncbi:hypothetical protein NDS46_16630 [Paenibacillus thiaminolyticus]|uniref:hypothetical protein n=1 Tax=Paenibacillus thiaminolyticus TaxID=49283 RepID=UPI00232B5B18|nr:hypothetical protein [Paenibacillus thiaminolyticus]WCF05995.1 hypothetical protein NDS46_16630 [Paenibacillus thiaminolyticus]